jgi:hypothetical protein
MPEVIQRRPRPAVRVAAALVAAATSSPPAAIFFFLSLYILHYRCDESCGGGSWVHSSDSPLWVMQFLFLALPTLVALTAFVVYLAKGRPLRAMVAFATAVVLFLLYCAFPVLTGGNPGAFMISRRPIPLVLLTLVVMALAATVSIAAEFISAHRSAHAVA